MLQGRQLCLLHVPPTVSRSLRDLGLGLNSGYSPYSLRTEECAASAFVAHSGSTRRGAKPICLLRAWPGAATVGHGGAGGISCYGLSALTVQQQQARSAEAICTQDFSSLVSLWESLICSLVLEKSTWLCWGCTTLSPLQSVSRPGVSEERDSVSYCTDIYCASGAEAGDGVGEACRRDHALPISGMSLTVCWKVEVTASPAVLQGVQLCHASAKMRLEVLYTFFQV